MTGQTDTEAIDTAFSRLSHLALARAEVFGLLAFAFFDPNEEFVDQIINGSYISEIHGYFQDLGNRRIPSNEAREAFAPLKAAQMELAQQNKDQVLRDMKVEYARLFIGPGHAAVPPYETFYGGKTKGVAPLLMVSPEALSVEAAYREAGVAMSSDLREPPDHFATECEFLYYLCKKESDCWAEDNNSEALKWRRQQLAFIDGHLGRWSVQFCEDIETASHHPFYRAIARLARTIIQIEGSDSIDSENKPDVGKPRPENKTSE
ncbi:MAG: molecular chaperone TorD family protein [Anaerolineales bacterium]|nr:molecular chaperone TorD family protein [Anaerolineales bacterium]